MATALSELENPAPSDEELELIDRYWRAANYLAVGQIYLLDNPLLRQPLALEHVKPRLLGHWGTTPGLNFIYAHLNRVINAHDLNIVYMCGPGHGGPALVANTYLEGTLLGALPRYLRGCRGAAKAGQAVLLPRRHSEPRGRRGSRLDPRGRRARVRGVARVRGSVRQSRPDRRMRGRGRRGRDRPARGGLALEQVPQPVFRRRRPADSPSERLQDRESDCPCPDRPGRAREPLRRLRLQALLRGGKRSRDDAPPDGRDTRPGVRRDRCNPARGPCQPGGGGNPSTLADDHPPVTEGLDRPEGDRRQEGRGSLAFPSGPDERTSPATRRTSRCSSSGFAATGQRSCSTTRAGFFRSCERSPRRARGEWARTPTPTAACSCATCGCRTSTTTRSTFPARARRSRSPLVRSATTCVMS